MTTDRDSGADTHADTSDPPAGPDRSPTRSERHVRRTGRGRRWAPDGDPLVSVVVPTYGRRPTYLADALASVAAGTYDPVELVVVDDSPADVNLRDRTLGADDRVDPGDFTDVCWLREGSHDGAGAARNTGIAAASGQYIAFLDDDDRWHERKLERQMATVDRAPVEVGLVYCGQRHVTADGTVRGVDRRTLRGAVHEAVLTGRPLAPFSTAVVRADVPSTVGTIDERFPVLEDREWYLRITAEEWVEVVTDPLVDRRSGDHDQLTADWEAYRTTYPLFLEKHRDTAGEFGARTERRFRAWLARTVGAVGVTTGNYREARSYLLEAARLDPFTPKTHAFLLSALGGDPVFRSLERVLGHLRGRGSGESVDGQ